MSMAEADRQALPADGGDDDWEDVRPSQPDDTISIISEDDAALNNNNQDYVEIDHPRKTSYPGRIYSNPKEDAAGPLPTLRKALYNLKDTLKDSVAQLEDFNQIANDSAVSISGPIMLAQQRQVDTLNVLLTNAAEDWEAYAMVKGGMSFDEFADLDPVAVNELARIFGRFVRDAEGKIRDLEKADNVDDTEEDEVDVEWLDFILPAVDEVNMLLRVPEEEGQPVLGESEPTIPQNKPEVQQYAAKAEASKQTLSQDLHDEKVHKNMMMVSDW
jgi:hypothetical protein